MQMVECSTGTFIHRIRMLIFFLHLCTDLFCKVFPHSLPYILETHKWQSAQQGSGSEVFPAPNSRQLYRGVDACNEGVQHDS